MQEIERQAVVVVVAAAEFITVLEKRYREIENVGWTGSRGQSLVAWQTVEEKTFEALTFLSDDQGRR